MLPIILCFIYARWTCKGVHAATSFVDRLQSYVSEWASATHEHNVVTEHRLHDDDAWVAYLQWYCRMDLPGPTTSVGTRTDYSVGPWDYPACATRHLMA
jgi:hypothetical protein